MYEESRLSFAAQLMDEFAVRTGLSDGSAKPRRYLWTDAFAVCNFLELHRRTGDKHYHDLALRLVDQVHHVLGRHREDDTRSGWLSGLEEGEGEKHPTAGGLRIGKEMPERRRDEPYSPDLEWDRDGQYFHYLTKWMHALARLAGETGQPEYLRWGRELAAAVHPRFTYRDHSGGEIRMFWKMSIDLSRPLVPSIGMHDPLDGFLTYLDLMAESGPGQTPELDGPVRDMAGICRNGYWATDDSLGIGGLLGDLLRTAHLIAEHGLELNWLLDDLLDASLFSLERFGAGSSLDYPADYRLAFRELGLSIGLHCVERLAYLAKENQKTSSKFEKFRSGITELQSYLPLCEKVESFWLDDANRRVSTWLDHLDINSVMLATSLVPDGFIGRVPARKRP